MNKFLNELQELADDGFHEDIVEQINSLGENACKMLEIGILQDELVKLGFEKSQSAIDTMNYFNDKLPFNLKFIIYFEVSRIIIAPPSENAVYLSAYTLTWQHDVLNKVKELIND
jgi:hypothetical protein